MVIREKHYTAQEFLEHVRQPNNHNRQLELEDGVIVEMAVSRPINTVVAVRLSTTLYNHVCAHKLGYVTGADGAFALSAHTVRVPDFCFVSKARYPQLPDEFTGGPDIAVELVSSREDILDKATEYLKAGTKLVWAVYPDKQTVHVLKATEPRWMVLKLEGTLSGEDVLPEFQLPLRAVFADD